MFFTIRKIIIMTFWGLLVLGGLVLYQNREIFHPLVETVQIARKIDFQPEAQQILGELSGEVIQITGADTFRMKDPHGTVYHFRFHGLDVPQQWNVQDKRQRELKQETKSCLSGLMLSNQIKVDLISTNETHGGLGIVYLNHTNINLRLVELGLARINREYLKRLPVKEQYTFLHAEKKAEQRELGIWR